MKKKIALFSALTMLIGTMSFVVQVNAVKPTVANGWNVNYFASAIQDATHYAEFTTEDSYEGDYSLHVNYTNGCEAEPKIEISHDARETILFSDAWGEPNKYRVQFYIKGDFDKWGIKVGTFDCDEDKLTGTLVRLTYNKVTVEPADANGWHKAYFDFSYPYNSDKSKFKISIYGSMNNVYVDNVSVLYNGTNATLVGNSLLKDGGFEPTPMATGETLANYGWSSSILNGAVATAEIVKSAGGDRMLHIQYLNDTYNDNLVLNRTVATPQGADGIDWAKYTIYFKIKGEYKPGNIEMGNDQYNEHLRFLNNSTYVKSKKLGDGWTQYAVQTAGQNKTGFKMIVHGYCRDFYVDDFKVVKEGTNQDHLANGTFDSPTAANEIQPSNWFTTVSGAAAQDGKFIVTRDGQKAYSGKNSMFIAAPGTWVDQKYIDFRQELPANFNYTKAYTLKAKIYTPQDKTDLRVGFSNAQNSFESHFLSSEATINELGRGWYEYSMPITAVSGLNQIRFLAINYVDGLWIDDVSLVDANGAEYLVNGSFEKYDRATVGAFSLLNDAYEEIPTVIVGSNTVSVSVRPKEANMNFSLYFVVYKDGKLFQCVETTEKNLPINTDRELTATISLTNVSDGVYSAKAFLWDENMTPYAENGVF